MGDGSLQAPRFDPKGKSRASTPASGDILALDLGAAEEGTANPNGDAFMKMQLVEQQVRVFISSRFFARSLTVFAGLVHPVAFNCD